MIISKIFLLITISSAINLGPYPQFRISKNHQIGKLNNLFEDYKIGFDLRLHFARGHCPRAKSAGPKCRRKVTGQSWSSVLHFTTGGNDENYGDRTPAVWLYDNKRLFVSSAINGNKNEHKELTTLRPYRWYSIEISQKRSNTTYGTLWNEHYGKVMIEININI